MTEEVKKINNKNSLLRNLLKDTFTSLVTPLIIFMLLFFILAITQSSKLSYVIRHSGICILSWSISVFIVLKLVAIFLEHQKNILSKYSISCRALDTLLVSLIILVFFLIINTQSEQIIIPKLKENTCINKETRNNDAINVMITKFCSLNQKSLFSVDFSEVQASRVYFNNMLFANKNFKLHLDSIGNKKIPIDFNIEFNDNELGEKDIDSMTRILYRENNCIPDVYITGEYLQSSDNILIFNHLIFKNPKFESVLSKINRYFCSGNSLDTLIKIAQVEKLYNYTWLKLMVNNLLEQIMTDFKMFEFTNSISYIFELNNSPNFCYHYLILLEYINLIENGNGYRKYLGMEVERELKYLINNIKFQNIPNQKNENSYLEKNNNFSLHLRLIYIYCLNKGIIFEGTNKIWKTIEIISDILRERQIIFNYSDYYNEIFILSLHYCNSAFKKNEESNYFMFLYYNLLMNKQSDKNILDENSLDYLKNVKKYLDTTVLMKPK